jgi:hypothetical protein
MSHGSFKVLDSDIHIIEPPDLWPRYIDPVFKDQASKRKILWDNCAAYYGLPS